MQEVQAKADENKKVKFKEKINRVIEWADQFKIDCKIYLKHQEAIQTIRSNIFDDDLVEKSLISLKELWQKYPKSREYLQVEYGNVDILLGCLKNEDEGVMLNACETLEVLVSNCSER